MRFLFNSTDPGAVCRAPHSSHAALPKGHSKDLVACDMCGRWECRNCLALNWEPQGSCPSQVFTILYDFFQTNPAPIHLLPFRCAKCAHEQDTAVQPFLLQLYESCKYYYKHLKQLEDNRANFKDAPKYKEVDEQIKAILATYQEDGDQEVFADARDTSATTSPQPPAEGDEAQQPPSKEKAVSTLHQEQLVVLSQKLNAIKENVIKTCDQAISAWKTTPEGLAYELTAKLQASNRIALHLTLPYAYVGPPPDAIPLYTEFLNNRFMARFPGKVGALGDVERGSYAHLVDVHDPVFDAAADPPVIDPPERGSDNISFYLNEGEFVPPIASTPVPGAKEVRFKDVDGAGSPQAEGQDGRQPLRAMREASITARDDAKRRETEVVAGMGLRPPDEHDTSVAGSVAMSTSLNLDEEAGGSGGAGGGSSNDPPASPEGDRPSTVVETREGVGPDTGAFLDALADAKTANRGSASSSGAPTLTDQVEDQVTPDQTRGANGGQGGSGQHVPAQNANPPPHPRLLRLRRLHARPPRHREQRGPAGQPGPSPHPPPPPDRTLSPSPPTPPPLPTMPATGPQAPPTRAPLLPRTAQPLQAAQTAAAAHGNTLFQQFLIFQRLLASMNPAYAQAQANASANDGGPSAANASANAGGPNISEPDSTTRPPPEQSWNPNLASTPQPPPPPMGGAAGGGGGGGGGDDDPDPDDDHNFSGRSVPMRGAKQENVSSFVPEDGEMEYRRSEVWLKYMISNAAQDAFDGREPGLFVPWLARLEARLKHVRATNHEAFELLLSHLKGAPRDMVARIIPNETQSYKRAVRILQTHYGSWEEIVRALRAELLSYPTLENLTLSKLEDWISRLLRIEESLQSIPKAPFKVRDYTTILWAKLSRSVQEPMRNKYLAQVGGLANAKAIDWPFIKGYLLDALEDEKSAARERQRVSKGPHSMSLVAADVAKDPTAGSGATSAGAGGGGKKKELTMAERRAAKFCAYCDKLGHSSIVCKQFPTDAERLKLIQEKALCQNCLKGHAGEECRGGVCLRCKQRHHTSIHTSFQSGSHDQPSSPNLVAHAGVEDVIHGTLCLNVSNPITGDARVLNCFLDGGSTRSALTREAQDALELESSAEVKLKTSTFHAASSVLIPASKVIAKLSSLYSSMALTVELLAVERICQDLHVPRMVNDPAFVKFVAGLPADVTNLPPATDSSFRVDILVGQDLLEAFVGATTRATPFGPYLSAYSSAWGTVLRGAVPGTTSPSSVHAGLINVCAPDTGAIVQSSRKRSLPLRDLEALLERQSDLEPLGWAEGAARQLQADDAATASLAASFVRLEDGRLESPLPLSEGTDFLPCNVGLVLARARSDHHRTPVIQLERQHAKLRELQDAGILEELYGVDLSPSTGRGVHYIPVFSVPKHALPDENGYRPMTGIRLVMDASSRTHAGYSLNDCLTTPPKTFASLAGVMLHGRCYTHAATADFKAAFFSVGISKEHRDFLRLLIPPSPQGPFGTKDFRVLRLTRLPMGTTPSPWVLSTALHFVLRQAIAGSTPRHGLRVSDLEMIERGTYCDNIVLGASSPSDLARIAAGTQKLFGDFGFELTTFASSPRKALDAIAVKDRLPEGATPYLGLVWVANDQDLLRVSHTDLPAPEDLDRASLTAAAHKVFDPFGQAGPLVVALKLLLRRAFSFGDPWDKPASEPVKQEYARMAKDLEHLHLLDIPRPLVENFGRRASLAVYSDANSHAFGCVLYIVQSAKPTFLLSKHRLTPVKRKGTIVTIPRAELWAVGLGVKFAAWALAELAGRLQVENVVVYSDSAVALYWIQKGSSLRPYEARRVQEIINAKVSQDFRYVASSENPADLLTKVGSMHDLSASNFLTGPAHIARPIHLWPNPSLPACDDRLIKGTPRSLLKVNNMIAATPAIPQPAVTDLIDVNRFNTLHKCLHVTALVYRACARPLAPPDDVVTKAGYKAVSEMEREKALIKWVRMAQDEVFQEEQAYLRLAAELSPDQLKARKLRVPQIVKQLKVFLDEEGLLRVRGRMCNVPAVQADFFPNPLLLPGKTRDKTSSPAVAFAELLAESVHYAHAHSGIASTCAQLRRKFWITGVGSLVSRVLRRCHPCGKVFRPPLPRPPLGNLPRARLTGRIPPFTHVCVDQLGPIQIVDAEGNANKRWVLVASCAGSRAVHLEPLASYSGDSVLQAFQRLWNRFGVGFGYVYADNAGAFTSAGVAFSALQDAPTFHSALPKLLAPLSHKSKVVFSPARAPWAQGAAETIVKMVKRSLLPCLYGVHATDETFATILSDVCASLNARPLTALSSSAGDPLPLTPMSLITGHLGAEGFPSSTADYKADAKVPKGHGAAKRAVQAFLARSRAMDLWWQRWLAEYLPMVRSRHLRQEGGRRKNYAELKPGAVVTIVGPGPRHGWRLGRIITACRSPTDNMVRSYWVRSSAGITSRQSTANLVPSELGEEYPLVRIPDPIGEDEGEAAELNADAALNEMGLEEEAPEEDDDPEEDGNIEDTQDAPLNRVITRGRSSVNSPSPN